MPALHTNAVIRLKSVPMAVNDAKATSVKRVGLPRAIGKTSPVDLVHGWDSLQALRLRGFLVLLRALVASSIGRTSLGSSGIVGPRCLVVPANMALRPL